MTAPAPHDLACTAAPISWPRLEHYALAPDDREIATHLETCAACRRCYDAIAADRVELRPLVAVAPAPAESWWRRSRVRWLVPVLASAVLALVLLWPRMATPPAPHAMTLVAIKGVGEVAVELVRDRDGAIAHGATGFRAGDRFELVLTCPPAATAQLPIAVEVRELASGRVDRPLPATAIACGNGVVVPGAFALTGASRHRVCAWIGDATTPACVELAPE